MMTDEKYNFVKMYERSFREHWNMPAVSDYGTDVTLTYGQLSINIEKLHILFKEEDMLTLSAASLRVKVMDVLVALTDCKCGYNYLAPFAM